MSYEVVDGVRAVVTREFAAPPDRVFAAFTDPQIAKQWMWGADAHNPAAEMDLRVGGRFRISIDAPEGDDSGWPSKRWGMSGVFVEIVPDNRLVYTLHWEGPVGYNQTGDDVLDEAVMVSFDPTDSGTRVVFEHVGIPDDGGSAAEHGRSVDATFRDLAALIED